MKLLVKQLVKIFFKSPSTRRVWIEIVAKAVKGGYIVLSPSTRRVWIEIVSQSAVMIYRIAGHPPHGGCGLKSAAKTVNAINIKSPSTRRVWIEIERRCL